MEPLVLLSLCLSLTHTMSLAHLGCPWSLPPVDQGKSRSRHLTNIYSLNKGIFTIALGGKHCHYRHFSDKKTETEGGSVSCLGPHRC